MRIDILLLLSCGHSSKTDACSLPSYNGYYTIIIHGNMYYVLAARCCCCPNRPATSKPTTTIIMMNENKRRNPFVHWPKRLIKLMSPSNQRYVCATTTAAVPHHHRHQSLCTSYYIQQLLYSVLLYTREHSTNITKKHNNAPFPPAPVPPPIGSGGVNPSLK